MDIQFATAERSRALVYIQSVYPLKAITDTPQSAGKLLDLVAKDIVRIQDPAMHGNQIAVIPGNKWNEQYRADVEDACKVLKGD